MQFKLAAVVVSLASMALASVPSFNVSEAVVPYDESLSEDEHALASALSALLTVPDEVLVQGDAKTHEWYSENLVAPAQSTDLVTTFDFETQSFFSCALAVGKLLASVGKVADKILLLKSLVNAFGGIVKMVKALLSGQTLPIVVQVRNILKEFGNVRKACKL